MSWLTHYTFHKDGERWISLEGALRFYQVSEYLLLKAVDNNQLAFSEVPSKDGGSSILILKESHIVAHHLLGRGHYTCVMINEELGIIEPETLVFISDKLGIIPHYYFWPTNRTDGSPWWTIDESREILKYLHSKNIKPKDPKEHEQYIPLNC